MAYELRKSDENVMIAEGARVAGDVTLGRGVNIWYNAVLRGDEGAITVGENTNIQDGAVLHEETKVGAGCTIGHNAIVHACTVGDNVLIGMGAVADYFRARETIGGFMLALMILMLLTCNIFKANRTIGTI